MTFDYNQKSTIGFCAEHGKGMGWSLRGQTWGNPKPITDPTVKTMMAYYYAHPPGCSPTRPTPWAWMRYGAAIIPGP